MRVTTNNTVETIARALRRAFKLADSPDEIEPIFREAAEGDDDSSGGVKWHGCGGVGIPGAKYHAMTGQTEKSNDVRQARKAAKSYRNKVINRAEYYDAFEKINSLKV